MKFICSCCVKALDNWPSLAYIAPANYYWGVAFHVLLL